MHLVQPCTCDAELLLTLLVRCDFSSDWVTFFKYYWPPRSWKWFLVDFKHHKLRIMWLCKYSICNYYCEVWITYGMTVTDTFSLHRWLNKPFNLSYGNLISLIQIKSITICPSTPSHPLESNYLTLTASSVMFWSVLQLFNFMQIYSPHAHNGSWCSTRQTSVVYLYQCTVRSNTKRRQEVIYLNQNVWSLVCDSG